MKIEKVFLSTSSLEGYTKDEKQKFIQEKGDMPYCARIKDENGKVILETGSFNSATSMSPSEFYGLCQELKAYSKTFNTEYEISDNLTIEANMSDNSKIVYEAENNQIKTYCEQNGEIFVSTTFEKDGYVKTISEDYQASKNFAILTGRGQTLNVGYIDGVERNDTFKANSFTINSYSLNDEKIKTIELKPFSNIIEIVIPDKDGNYKINKFRLEDSERTDLLRDASNIENIDDIEKLGEKVIETVNEKSEVEMENYEQLIEAILNSKDDFEDETE